MSGQSKMESWYKLVLDLIYAAKIYFKQRLVFINYKYKRLGATIDKNYPFLLFYHGYGLTQRCSAKFLQIVSTERFNYQI